MPLNKNICPQTDVEFYPLGSLLLDAFYPVATAVVTSGDRRPNGGTAVLTGGDRRPNGGGTAVLTEGVQGVGTSLRVNLFFSGRA